MTARKKSKNVLKVNTANLAGLQIAMLDTGAREVRLVQSKMMELTAEFAKKDTSASQAGLKHHVKEVLLKEELELVLIWPTRVQN